MTIKTCAICNFHPVTDKVKDGANIKDCCDKCKTWLDGIAADEPWEDEQHNLADSLFRPEIYC